MSTDPNLPTDPATPPADPTPAPPAPTPTPADDMAAFRAELQRERQAREAAEAKLQQQQEESLRKSKNWEELARLKSEEAENNRTKYEKLHGTIIQNEKLMRLKAECTKLGINPEALEDLDYMVDNLNISVEATSTGKILVHGAEAAAQLLKARKPFWFAVKPASVNPASPTVTVPAGGKMTMETLMALEKEYKKNPTQENKQKYQDGVIKYKNGL
jgi:hypothetical protein